jgi:cytochrome b subunit of formate dehydrogenase
LLFQFDVFFTELKMSPSNLSKQTLRNWTLDAFLLGSGILTILSGIYFLFLPSGGYQGGRNPYYNLQVLFSRQTWDDLHTWGGVAMIAIALYHLVLHWPWLVSMTRKSFRAMFGKAGKMNARGRWNLILNLFTAISFMLTALSGIYFLFFPGGRGALDPRLLFTRTTWDLIHTWAGVSFITGAVLHFAIHWLWIAKVTRKLFGHSQPAGAAHQAIPAIQS